MLQFVLQLCCSCVAVQVHATQQDTFHWHESFWQLCPTKVATLVLGSHHPHLAKTMEYMSSTTPIQRPLKPWPKLRRRNVTSTVTMRMFIATWRTFWNSRTVIEITLKLANLRKRRAQNWARQTAPVLVPRKWRGTKTGAVWRTRFWARLLHKIVSLSVVSITSPPFQNTFFKFQKPSPWQQGR